MYTYTHLEMMSYKDCMKIASLDAPKMSSDSRAYVEANSLQYYVAINSWLFILKEYSTYAWTHFAEHMQKFGLIETIRYCQDQAQIFINCEENDDFMRTFYNSLERLNVNNSLFQEKNIDKLKSVTFLFLLRYLKRFSPNGNDLVQLESMKDFKATENRLKQLSRREMNPFVVALVRDEVAHMYPWNTICKKIRSLSIDDMEFTSGVCRGTRATLYSKCKYLASSEYCEVFFPQIFGERVVDIPSVHNRKYIQEEYKAVTPQPVPKSFKAARIIAPENVYRQGMGKAIEKIFRKIDNSRCGEIGTKRGPAMNLEDQTINQRLAKEGSETGKYATLDASHASDMISKVLFRSIFPTEFVEAVEPYMDEYIDYGDGTVRAMQMMSTAGHSLTFRLETIVYLAIARAATHLCDRMGAASGESFQCWAYGDDTIVPTYAAETAIDFFSSLGLVINVDKSYFSPNLLYRESCGEEYYMGQDCTSLYFPRFPLKGTVSDKGVWLDAYTYHDGRDDTLSTSQTMLIALQKKLYPYSKDAAYFLLEVLKNADRRITVSIPYDDASTDPWGLLDTGKPVKHPTYEVVACSYNQVLQEGYSLVDMPKRAAYFPDMPYARAIVKTGDAPAFCDFGAYEEFSKAADLDTYHSCPVAVVADKGDGSEDWIFQAFKYREFLLHGPSYDSPLDELLGVSSPSLSYSEFCGERELKMKFVVK